MVNEILCGLLTMTNIKRLLPKQTENAETDFMAERKTEKKFVENRSAGPGGQPQWPTKAAPKHDLAERWPRKTPEIFPPQTESAAKLWKSTATFHRATTDDQTCKCVPIYVTRRLFAPFSSNVTP